MNMLLRLAGAVTDPAGLSIAEPDALIELFEHPNVLFLCDASKTSSWSGAAPSNGAAVYDLTRHDRDAAWVNSPAMTLATTGGGWDFAAATDIGPHIAAPASIASTLWNGGANHHWLLLAWVKVPASAEFGSTASKLCPIISFSDAAPTTPGNEEIGSLNWYRDGSGNRIYYARKESASVLPFGYLSPTSDHYGKIAQLAVWWDGTSLKARLKTIDGFELNDTTASTGSNTENFSGQTLKVGPIKSWTTSVPATGDMKDWRLYRAAVVDLTSAGVSDPITKLDEEFDIVVTRAAFS